jgi:hypothetical protein
MPTIMLQLALILGCKVDCVKTHESIFVKNSKNLTHFEVSF